MKLEILKKKLEGIGLLLIMLAFFGQMLSSSYNDSLLESDLLFISENQNHIWQLVSDDYTHRYPDRSDGITSTANYGNLEKGYKYWEDRNKQRKILQDEQAIVERCWIFLFLLGNTLIIYDKVKN